jgi:type I restriction enzyme, S subunit
MLSERVKSQAVAFQNRTGIPKINREQLGSVFLLKPSLEEQAEIAAILNACNVKITSLDEEISLLEELFRALLEELMTGRLLTLPLIEKGETHE